MNLIEKKAYLNRLRQKRLNLLDEISIDKYIKETEEEISQLERQLENIKINEDIKPRKLTEDDINQARKDWLKDTNPSTAFQYTCSECGGIFSAPHFCT